jgi:hypothetical protein
MGAVFVFSFSLSWSAHLFEGVSCALPLFSADSGLGLCSKSSQVNKNYTQVQNFTKMFLWMGDDR